MTSVDKRFAKNLCIRIQRSLIGDLIALVEKRLVMRWLNSVVCCPVERNLEL